MDDLIYRQAAIDALNVSVIFGRCNGKTVTLKALKKYAEDVRGRIDALPSAQPERPKGHWIDTGSGQECSECGEVQYGYDNFRYYCAKCGSDNRGK